MMVVKPFPSLEELRAGNKRLIGRVLSRIEARAFTKETASFLDTLASQSKAHVIGLTGPPGVGKSTLTDAFIRGFRFDDKSVAVLAVDPSSSVTNGALLGDRARLQLDPMDEAIFVRSMAARDRLGGLSNDAVAAICVLRALFDIVIVETVGIGQSESDLRDAVDSVILCIQPGSGDSLQFMKAGIIELPDIFAVTKADMKALSSKAIADLKGARSLNASQNANWKVPICSVSAQTGEGVEELKVAVHSHFMELKNQGSLASYRASQHVEWFEDMVNLEFGRLGMRALASNKQFDWKKMAREKPFSCFEKFSAFFSKALQF